MLKELVWLLGTKTQPSSLTHSSKQTAEGTNWAKKNKMCCHGRVEEVLMVAAKDEGTRSHKRLL